MSKHKPPKNDKYQPRKDLKDYTIDKEVEGMVPNASGEPMPEVPRKDDKPVIDDVENMVPKVKDSDKIYVTKELQDGDPKMPANALKTLVKNQQDDAEELIDTMSKKDGGYMSQIKKLTKEGTCYLADCSRANKKINNFANLLEKKFNTPVDCHIYFSLHKRSTSFSKHKDEAHNLIVTCEGEIEFEIFLNKKINKKLKTG